MIPDHAISDLGTPPKPVELENVRRQGRAFAKLKDETTRRYGTKYLHHLDADQLAELVAVTAEQLARVPADGELRDLADAAKAAELAFAAMRRRAAEAAEKAAEPASREQLLAELRRVQGEREALLDRLAAVDGRAHGLRRQLAKLHAAAEADEPVVAEAKPVHPS